jgi:hypothetical protein
LRGRTPGERELCVDRGLDEGSARVQLKWVKWAHVCFGGEGSLRSGGGKGEEPCMGRVGRKDQGSVGSLGRLAGWMDLK